MPAYGLREIARRNILVSLINSGLERGLFGTVDGENAGLVDRDNDRFPRVEYSIDYAGFRFDCSVIDIWWNELRVAAVVPDLVITSKRKWTEPRSWCSGVRLESGFSVIAEGWLRRSDRSSVLVRDCNGQWRTTSGHRPIYHACLERLGRFKCRQSLLKELTRTAVEPHGFYFEEFALRAPSGQWRLHCDGAAP